MSEMLVKLLLRIIVMTFIGVCLFMFCCNSNNKIIAALDKWMLRLPNRFQTPRIISSCQRHFAMERTINANQEPEEQSVVHDDSFSIPITLHDQCAHTLRKKNEMFDLEGRCRGCFLFKSYCMCSAARAIFQPALNDPLSLTNKIDFCLFMHFKEWGRASNTGKLLNVGLGDEKAGIYIFGHPEQEQALIEKLRSRPSLILYPNKNAKPITEYKHYLDAAAATGEPLQLCVIDTTWSLSAAMDRNLPDDIPRVMIDKDLVTGPSKFLNRKQNTNKHKVSTIEAVALAMQSLLPPAEVPTLEENLYEDPLPKELHCYRTALEYSVDSVLKQAGRQLAYGHDVHAQFDVSANDQIHFGPVTRPKTEKPLVCVNCGRRRCNENGEVVDNVVNFKNFGKKYRVFPRSEIINYSPSEQMCPTEKYIREMAVEQVALNDTGGDEIEVLFRMWRCNCCKEYFPYRV